MTEVEEQTFNAWVTSVVANVLDADDLQRVREAWLKHRTLRAKSSKPGSPAKAVEKSHEVMTGLLIDALFQFGANPDKHYECT